MIDLVAKSAAEGLLPITIGDVTLSEVPARSIHSIAPFKGARVKDFPAPGKSASYKDGTLVWSARGQFFLLGATPPKMKAAITDQTDAWCSVDLVGRRTSDVLARLCPLDTRAMKAGDVARSLVGHMPALILRTGQGFQVMVFRAFARTLVHELTGAMTSVAAQENLAE